MKTVFIVDDNIDFCYLLSNILEKEGYSVKDFHGGMQALQVIEKNPPDVILLDIQLPDINGLQVLEKLKSNNKDLTIIMLTAFGEIHDAVKAMKAGAFDYILKPFNQEKLLNILKKAIHKCSSLTVQGCPGFIPPSEITEHKLIGKCDAFQHIIADIKKIALTNTTVILQGESGCGKELFAKMIHQESPRKNKPFIPIDCGAIPENLIEGELFGYEKGAFTNANTAHKGKFELANHGTLFLDEITNLSESAQTKLLRVIEEKKIWHLGGTKAVTLDIRIITASNIDIINAVHQKKFRKDLFYRLNEFTISIPPLRERIADIPEILSYYIQIGNKEFSKQVKSFSPQALKLLLDYPWPGNVRELKNVIRMSVLFSRSDCISQLDLPQQITAYKPDISCQKSEQLDSNSFKSATYNIEREMIIKTLIHTEKNKTKAAELLQINRKTLYRKMKNLNINC
ncbi:MAG: sigma-54-dependent Fis family transcriptional regulator [Bacteroidetes bacterium]|nr:sigma-54-dependent Fis family transcriptional regulator [Bacteroidota bacterium]